MTELKEKISSFKARQQKIMQLSAQYVAKVDEISTECQNRIDAIKTEFETRKAEASSEFEKEKDSYKADLKTAFGVTDGESANILDLVQLIGRVAGKL